MKKILLPVLLLVTGCTSGPIQVNFPMNRLESPEAEGKLLSGRVHGGHRSVENDNLTADYAVNPVGQSAPTFSSVATRGYGAGIGLLDRLDFNLKENADAPTLYELKFQIIGATTEDAHKGNFSVSITGGYGEQGDSGSANGGPITVADNGTINLLGATAGYQLTSKVYDFGVVAGLRPIEDLLFYAGVSETIIHYSGSQTLYTQQIVPFSGSAKQILGHVGTIYYIDTHQKARVGSLTIEPYLQGELAFAKIADGSTNGTNVNGALNFGIVW